MEKRQAKTTPPGEMHLKLGSLGHSPDDPDSSAPPVADLSRFVFRFAGVVALLYGLVKLVNGVQAML